MTALPDEMQIKVTIDPTAEEARQIAKAKTLGVIDAICRFAGFAGIVLIIFGVFIQPTDPTDLNTFTRSGLRYFKDYGTGREFIAGPDGRLIDRNAP